MDKRLVEASLAPELTPRKFKFTSEQGRTRRTQLLAAARELLAERQAEEVSFADVCERAGIPRPSAYHFFPNIQAIFLGLRVLHAEILVEAVLGLEGQEFESWRDYLGAMIEVGVQATFSDPAFPRLVYGTSLTLKEFRQLGQDLDRRLADITLEGITRRFQIPEWDTREQCFAVAFTIIDSLMRQSYRREERASEWIVAEARRAAVAYLRLYLPEVCPPRE